MDEFLINISDPIDYTFKVIKEAVSPYNRDWFERKVNETYNLKLIIESQDDLYRTIVLVDMINLARQCGLNVKVIRR